MGGKKENAVDAEREDQGRKGEAMRKSRRSSVTRSCWSKGRERWGWRLLT